MLQLLMLKLLLNVLTERHRAFHFLAMFCMVAAKSYQLFTYWTASISFSFANLGMLHNSFHFHTALQSTTAITALTCMDQ
jgi:hypothetical protein